MTDHVDCLGTPTLFVHYNLTFNFLELFFCWLVWFGFAYLRSFFSFFSFGSHSGVSAQTEKVLVFIHLCLLLHFAPV